MRPESAWGVMRRSRFVSAIDQNDTAGERPSISEALWYDLRNPETTDEMSLADWRIAGLDHVAILLGFTHLLITIGYVLLSAKIPFCACFDNPLIPSSMVLMLDVAAASALVLRHRFKFQPHTIVRGLCAYLAIAGLLWIRFGQTVQDDLFTAPISAAQIVMCAGIAMGAIVSIGSPPLALVNAIVSAAAAIVLARSSRVRIAVESLSPVPMGVEILSLVLGAYSIAGTRKVLVAGRGRLRLDLLARKALRFVDEFE